MKSAIFGILFIMSGMAGALVFLAGPQEQASIRVFVPEAVPLAVAQ